MKICQYYLVIISKNKGCPLRHCSMDTFSLTYCIASLLALHSVCTLMYKHPILICPRVVSPLPETILSYSCSCHLTLLSSFLHLLIKSGCYPLCLGCQSRCYISILRGFSIIYARAHACHYRGAAYKGKPPGSKLYHLIPALSIASFLSFYSYNMLLLPK